MRAEVILPLPRPELTIEPATEAPKPSQAPMVPPEQGPAAMVSAMAGVGASTWWRLHSAGKVPRPNKLGGKTLWRLQEIREWIASGCPGRQAWEAMQKVRK